jgi:hypothetical protein
MAVQTLDENGNCVFEETFFNAIQYPCRCCKMNLKVSVPKKPLN